MAVSAPNSSAARLLVWALLAAPMAWMLFGYASDRIFYGELLHASGELSARLLILTLAVTPLRLMFPGSTWTNWLHRQRRYLGVASFAYAFLHTAVYIERKQSLSLILDEAGEFYMWTGWTALLLFAVLALTSNDAAARRLKKIWKKLHRWVYAAALLTFLHWIFSAFDFVPGLVHLGVLVTLEAYRVWKQSRLRRAAP